MSTVPEIEAAIRRLSPAEVEELAAWLTSLRAGPTAAGSAGSPTDTPVEQWLGTAIGAAKTGLTSDQVMSMTRGEQ